MNINSDKTALKMLTASLVGLAALIVGICAGSVSIALQDTFSIIQAKLFGGTLSSSVDASLVSILWEIRKTSVNR